MKSFFVKMLIFGTPILLFIIFIPKIIDRGLINSSYNPNYDEWEDIVHSRIKSEIIIQGSSRACHHISPLALDTFFHTSSYNLGLIGHHFIMQYYRFELFKLYNKKPKYIIQALDLYTLYKENPAEIEQFLPYLNYTPIKEGLDNYNVFTYLDYKVPFLKYLHCRNSIFFGLIGFFKKPTKVNSKFKGFEAMNFVWNSSFYNFKKSKPKGYIQSIDSFSLTLFKKFLDYCTTNDIRVILVYTPEYIEAQELCLNRDSILNLYNSLAIKYKIPFFDYSNDSISFNRDYFYNSQHLNLKGTNAFNKKLVRDLQSVIDGFDYQTTVKTTK